MFTCPFIGVIPLFITVLLTFKVRSPSRALALGAGAALILRLMEILSASFPTSFMALMSGIAIFGKETFQTVYEILCGKAAILLSVWMLLSLVHLICDSGLISLVENAVSRHAETPRRFASLFIILCTVFSIDDYLDCVVIPAATGKAAVNHGIRKETMAYLTSMLSIAFCVLIPFSSWAPFITSTVKDSLAGQNGNILQLISFQARIMDLAVLTLPVLAAVLLLSDASAPMLHRIKRKQACGLPDSKTSLMPLFTTGLAMALSMLIVNSCTNGDFTVAAGGAAGLATLFFCLLRSSEAGFRNLIQALKKGGDDTLTLSRTLLAIWILTAVCSDSLSLSKDIGMYMENISASACLIPGLIYFASGIFAYITGSSFGSIGLFVPLSITMTKTVSPGFLTPAAVSAALAGSMQAGNSVASDTIQLTQERLHGEEFKLRAMQRSMALIQGSAGMIGYLLMGALSGKGPIVMTLVPAFCICLFYAFFFGRRRTACSILLRPLIRHMDPFPRQVFTFHMAVAIAEQYYMHHLLSLIAHSLNRIRKTSFRREILCLRSP